jgi:hypothetical protein
MPIFLISFKSMEGHYCILLICAEASSGQDTLLALLLPLPGTFHRSLYLLGMFCDATSGSPAQACHAAVSSILLFPFWLWCWRLHSGLHTCEAGVSTA